MKTSIPERPFGLTLVTPVEPVGTTDLTSLRLDPISQTAVHGDGRPAISFVEGTQYTLKTKADNQEWDDKHAD